ncbi:MAG TPA: GNAT family N-acetyltransferase [Streptosporangiaceae bacterium]|jgi:GNAT superfamily N-acetyltransferase
MDRTLVATAPLRQAGPADSDAIREFVCGLSLRTQRLRFFAAVAPPSTGLLRALCGVTGRADILLVTDSDGTMIAHGMAADAHAREGLESSIGLVVADGWQRRGIGTQLLRALMIRAARRGVGSLVLEVLPDNHVMRGIIARQWPDAPAEWTPDALVYRPAIPPETSLRTVPAAIRISQPGDSGDHSAPGRSAA